MPNPFNPITRIGFGLPTPQAVTREVFGQRGGRVITRKMVLVQ